MGRPKNYWYGIVRQMVRRYPQLMMEQNIQSGIFCKAIEKTIEETAKLPNGNDRLKVVDVVLFTKTKTVEGVAIDVNYSERTVQSWINSFINAVGRNAGF